MPMITSTALPNCQVLKIEHSSGDAPDNFGLPKVLISCIAPYNTKSKISTFSQRAQELPKHQRTRNHPVFLQV